MIQWTPRGTDWPATFAASSQTAAQGGCFDDECSGFLNEFGWCNGWWPSSRVQSWAPSDAPTTSRLFTSTDGILQSHCQIWGHHNIIPTLKKVLPKNNQTSKKVAMSQMSCILVKICFYWFVHIVASLNTDSHTLPNDYTQSQNEKPLNQFSVQTCNSKIAQ